MEKEYIREYLVKMPETHNNGIGLGFFSFLTLLSIGLKLTGYIAWSWIWVLSPMWLPIVVMGVILVICFLAALVWVYMTN